MKKLKLVLALLFLVIPALSLWYKTQVINVSLLPISSIDEWKFQIDVHPRYFEKKSLLDIPLPRGMESQDILDLEFPKKISSQVFHTQSGSLLRVSAEDAKAAGSSSISVNARVKLNGFRFERLSEQSKFSNSGVRYALRMDKLSEEDRTKLEELTFSLYYEEDSKATKLRKIYYFLTEEMVENPAVESITEALMMNEVSEFTRAKMFTYMARLTGIASRTAIGFVLDPSVKVGKNQVRPSFYNEFYIDRQWVPVLVNYPAFGRYPSNFFSIHGDISDLEGLLENRDSFHFFAEPVKVNRADSTAYSTQLTIASQFFSSISLYSLPLSVQGIFYSILLIPFGAVILAFCRNLIGVNTFGIFTPVLLTLFFIETSLLVGLVFFGFIVALGFFERSVLDRFHLLAVPRLSILLTLVIISYVCFSLWATQTTWISMPNTTLNYFPIVIITVFIERFSVYFIEEGLKNTLKTLMGTLVVSIGCYLIFTVDVLKLFVFTHPELLLVAISLNIFIGSYKGYRFLELLRFKEFKRIQKQ